MAESAWEIASRDAEDHWSHFESTKAPSDLEAAIEAYRRVAGESAPAEEHRSALTNLGLALTLRWEALGDSSDLLNAIEVLQAAVAVSGAGSESSAAHSNLGAALIRRFEALGSASGLVQAIQVLRRAVEVASSSNEYHVALSNLGPALMRQFEVTGNAADLFEAIDLLRAAVESSSSGIERRKALSNLGAALMRQWEITGKSSSLLDSLQILGQAVEIKSNDSDLPAARYNYLLALLAAVNEGQDFPERQKLPEILARFEPDLIRVIESRFVRFGALHPATIEARINLASLYQAQADYPSARKELRSVLEDATEVLGAQHPTTITAATNLARALQSVGRASDAAEVLSTAHEASQKIYGLEDSHTLAIGSMLLCSFTLAVSSQGSSGSIDSRLTELGRGHPDAVFTMLLSSIGWDSWGDSAIPKTASKNYLVREYHPPHVTSMQVDDVLDVHIDLDRLADAIRVRLDQTPHRAICPPSEDGQQIPQFAAYAQNAIEKAFDGIDQRFSRMENAATLISKIVLIKTDDKVLMIPVEGTEVEFLESNQYLFQHPSSLLERIRSKRKLIVHRSRYEDGLASNSIP